MELINTETGPDGMPIRFVKVEEAGNRPCIYYYSQESDYEAITAIANRDGISPADVDFVDMSYGWHGAFGQYVAWKSVENLGFYPKIRGYAVVPEPVQIEFLQLAYELNLT